ncbi:MAG: FkbM family methyltransferase [Rickettsiales bacterium]|nr:FkbM family methyltransferase [Rickettsiales bacterium]
MNSAHANHPHTAAAQQALAVAPFGTHTPRGLNALIKQLVAMGIGVGSIKKRLAVAWGRRNGDAPVDVTYHGLKLRLQPQHNTIESKLLFSSRLREGRELSHMKTALAQGGVCIDIGANMGYYALMAAHMGATRVLALEPNPVMFARLCMGIALNKFEAVITPLQMGASDVAGSLTLTICDTDYGSSSAVNTTIHGEQITVEVAPLLPLLEAQGITRIDVMKIDVEGMEDRILFAFFEQAAAELLPRVLIMEDNRTLWKRDVIEWLLSHGYRIRENTHANLVLYYAA